MNKTIITNLTVRFSDIDAMGHVNNAVFFTYFEEGRKEFLYSLFNIINPEDYSFILAHLDCDFIKPVTLSDTIVLHTWIGEISNKRFDFKYRIVNRQKEGVVYAEGHSVQVFYDYTEQSTVPIPDSFREKIMVYQEK